MTTHFGRAVRALRRSPGFTLVAALTLALGIGATTAIYALLDAVVLRPFPYPEPERLVAVEHAVPGVKADARWHLSTANYFYYGRESRTLAALGIWRGDAVSLADPDGAERVPSAAVSPNLLTDVLRLRPHAGRLFAEADSRPGAPRVAVLGHALWRDRFGGDPAVVGREIRVNGRPVTVVGVAPAGAAVADRAVSVWLPLALDPAAEAQNHHTYDGIARLRPGATPEAAAGELAPLAARLPELFPTAYSPRFMRETGFRPVVTPLLESVVGPAARALWILLAAVGLVLLIACANVANLLLVRAESRRREVALRVALGAGRGQLARESLGEAAALGALGAAGGLALAWAAVRVVPRMAPEGVPRLADAGLGWRAVLAAAAVSLGTVAVLALLPLLRTRAHAALLREGGRGLTDGRPRQAVRQALVVGQVALALVLLTAAGLMAESFRRLRNVRPGVEPAGVVAFDALLPRARYDSYAKTTAFYQALAARVAVLPGVGSASMTASLPLEGELGCTGVLVADGPRAGGEAAACVPASSVAPNYFRTMGIAVRGDAPGWGETVDARAGAVVSRAFARRMWPGEDPIGKALKINDGPRPPYFPVVGVAEDVRADGLDRPPAELVYFPLQPMEGTVLWGALNGVTVVVRMADGTAAPGALATAARRAVADIDPTVAVANVRTMEAVVARSTARVAFTMTLLATAAAMALLLSVVGLYGVLSYMVGLRTREIGVRVALGARPAQVRRLVVAQSARLAGAGLLLGAAGALATTGVLRALLFEVRPADPRVLGAMAALLAAVAILASYLPARRAARVDPMTALRTE